MSESSESSQPEKSESSTTLIVSKTFFSKLNLLRTCLVLTCPHSRSSLLKYRHAASASYHSRFFSPTSLTNWVEAILCRTMTDVSLWFQRFLRCSSALCWKLLAVGFTEIFFVAGTARNSKNRNILIIGICFLFTLYLQYC